MGLQGKSRRSETMATRRDREGFSCRYRLGRGNNWDEYNAGGATGAKSDDPAFEGGGAEWQQVCTERLSRGHGSRSEWSRELKNNPGELGRSATAQYSNASMKQVAVEHYRISVNTRFAMCCREASNIPTTCLTWLYWHMIPRREKGYFKRLASKKRTCRVQLKSL